MTKEKQVEPSYWWREGYEDGLIKKKKSEQFFFGAQQIRHYDDYLAGYRSGRGNVQIVRPGFKKEVRE